MFLDQKPKSHYNYFAHIRTVLYPKQTITLAKKLTLDDYNKAVVLIGNELNELQNRYAYNHNMYRQKGDKKYAEEEEKINFRLQAYNPHRYHQKILKVLQCANRNTETFDMLIRRVVTGEITGRYFHYTPTIKEEETFLRQTFTKRYFSRNVYNQSTLKRLRRKPRC